MNADILERHCSGEAKDMVLVFLREHPNSFPRMVLDDYVHDDGRQEIMLKLIGGVSIVYGGGHYKLPAHIILPQGFPVEPPIVYMNPNETMVRNAKSPYVDANLLVRTDYIDRWSYPFSNLCHMYEDLKAKFSVAPPLKNRNINKAASSSHSPAQEERYSTFENKDIRSKGIAAMKSSLNLRICRMLNVWLDSDFQLEKASFSKTRDQHVNLRNDLDFLTKERENLDNRISACMATITKLDEWLDHANHKSLLHSDSKLQSPVDAYQAILTTRYSLNDLIEADACINGVNDAMRCVDEAFMESRIVWNDYKKMLSQLAHYKFQAKILENAAKRSENIALKYYTEIDPCTYGKPHGYPILQSQGDHLEEEIDLENPLGSI